MNGTSNNFAQRLNADLGITRPTIKRRLVKSQEPSLSVLWLSLTRP